MGSVHRRHGPEDKRSPVRPRGAQHAAPTLPATARGSAGDRGCFQEAAGVTESAAGPTKLKQVLFYRALAWPRRRAGLLFPVCLTWGFITGSFSRPRAACLESWRGLVPRVSVLRGAASILRGTAPRPGQERSSRGPVPLGPCGAVGLSPPGDSGGLRAHKEAFSLPARGQPKPRVKG